MLASEAAGGNDPIAEFCDQLKLLVPETKIKKESDTPFQKPALIVGSHRNIAYRAAPTGKILHNFLSALTDDLSQHHTVSRPVEALLEQVDLPVILKLYVAVQCPHCPVAMQQLQALALASSRIQLMIIDAEAFPISAREDDVRSVPTIILDDQFRWSGLVDSQELITLCVQRDPSDLSAASLRQLIEEGSAERVAAMMADSGQIFPGLIALLTHPRWSVRLGAMVTVEYLADAAPALAVQMGDLLWAQFQQLSDQVQGDVVHLLGEITSPVNAERLRGIAGGAYDESVKEAAAEILAEMGS
jgi:glutaredoxin